MKQIRYTKEQIIGETKLMYSSDITVVSHQIHNI